MEILIIPGIIILVFLVWFIGNYNVLVRLQNHCDESWSNIDTELKRRYNLIPNLVETVKGYAAHEKDVLDRVIKARNAAEQNHGSIKSQADDENILVSTLNRLFILVENYPELKANQNFLSLQDELSNTENRIQRARRFFNGNVRDFNNRCQVFPSNIIAGLFGFSTRDFFEVEEATMRSAPKVDLS